MTSFDEHMQRIRAAVRETDVGLLAAALATSASVVPIVIDVRDPDETAAPLIIDHVGADRFIWATDFPHPDHPAQWRRPLEKFLAPLEVEPLGLEVMWTYGELRAALERKGRPIGSLDTLIAAHALALDATLVTNDLREFERVPGLKLENWARP